MVTASRQTPAAATAGRPGLLAKADAVAALAALGDACQRAAAALAALSGATERADERQVAPAAAAQAEQQSKQTRQAERRAAPPRTALLTYLYRGQPMTVAELAEMVGCPYQSMYYRLRMHNVEEAVAMPYRARSAHTGPALPTHASPWNALDAKRRADKASGTRAPAARKEAAVKRAAAGAAAPNAEPAPSTMPDVVDRAPIAPAAPANAPAKAPALWTPGCADAAVPPTPVVVASQPRRPAETPTAEPHPPGALVTRAPAPRQQFAVDQPPQVFAGRVGRYESTGSAIERAYGERGGGENAELSGPGRRR